MYQSDITHEVKSLRHKLESLYTLSRGADIKLGFRACYIDLLKSLGDPHLNCPPIIHVAGTNGKGSTIAIMRSILEEAGHKVHVYTSPHLVHFNERIVLAGQEISDEYLESLIDEVISINGDAPCTFFEITTALAFLAFSRVSADIVLLETGLGGRLDCTNIVPNPAMTVITKIGLDHTEYLGDSLSDIAGEKAGIIKEDVPCVVSFQGRGKKYLNIKNTIEKRIKEKRSVSFFCGNSWSVQKNDTGFLLNFDEDVYQYPYPSLLGEHQIYNAGTAICSLKILESTYKKIGISEGAICTGLRNVSWRARMQSIDMPSFVSLPSSWRMYLDGGHNEDAGRVIHSQIQNWQSEENTKVHLVLSMMGHKDAKSFLAPFIKDVDSVSVFELPDEPHAMKSDSLEQAVLSLRPQMDVFTAQSVDEAVSNIINKDDVNANSKGFRNIILIAGSLYLAGHVLKNLQK